MRANFYGFGLVFDTYDNDNLRDNPSVFVLKHTPAPFDTDVMTDFVAPDFPVLILFVINIGVNVGVSSFIFILHFNHIII